MGVPGITRTDDSPKSTREFRGGLLGDFSAFFAVHSPDRATIFAGAFTAYFIAARLSAN